MTIVSLSSIGSISKTESLIIIHGLFGSKQNWSSIVKALNSKGITTAALDLRNHGESGWNDDGSVHSMSRDIIGFLDKNGIEKAHILGHSLGGKVGMRLAWDFPSRVQSLISVDMSPFTKNNSKEMLFYIQEMKKVEGIENKAKAKEILGENIQNSLVLQFLLSNLVRKHDKFDFRINLQALENSLQGIFAQDIQNSGVYNEKALFIEGSRADYINSSHHSDIKKMFPRAKFEYLDTGHWVHYEKPREFMELVLDFVKR